MSKKHMTRTSALVRAAVPAAVLALTLTACNDDTGGSDPAKSPASEASAPEESATDGAVDPGSDPANHVPSNTAGEKESIEMTMEVEGQSLTFEVAPLGVKTGSAVEGGTTYLVYADFTYLEGDAELMKLAPAGITLYSDDKSPEQPAREGSDEIAECWAELEKRFTDDVQPQTSITGCTPFLIPADQKIEVGDPENTGVKNYHVGMLTPGKQPPKVAAVWTIDDNPEPSYE